MKQFSWQIHTQPPVKKYFSTVTDTIEAPSKVSFISAKQQHGSLFMCPGAKLVWTFEHLKLDIPELQYRRGNHDNKMVNMS